MGNGILEKSTKTIGNGTLEKSVKPLLKVTKQLLILIFQLRLLALEIHILQWTKGKTEFFNKVYVPKAGNFKKQILETRF